MLINVDAYFLSNFGEVEFGVFSISFFLFVTIKNYQRNLFQALNILINILTDISIF